MADLVFNIAKGKVKYYAELPGTNDALIMVPLESAGLEADATLKDYDDLASLLAGTSNESAIGRKTITADTITVDDTADALGIDVADQTWATATGNPLGAILICYDPDTTGGTDSSIVPLTKHDFATTPDGSDLTAQINAAGFFRAT